MTKLVPTPNDPRFKDLTGVRFGRLEVTGYLGKMPPKEHGWQCRCDCGKEATVRGRNLKSGNTMSCGCIAFERASTLRLSHGHSRGRVATPEFKTWLMINDRCHNPKASGYQKYGAKGIVVCERWRRDFLTFLDDMGAKPSRAHSIDRIDNNRGYEPDNCRWATSSEQAYNRTTAHFLMIDGVKMHLKDAAALGPVAESAVLRRLRKGWSDEDAVFAPPRPGVKRPHLAGTGRPLPDTGAEDLALGQEART